MIGWRAPGAENRAFWWMVAASVFVRALLAYGVCCLVLAISGAVRSNGVAALWSNDPNLLPGLAVLAVVAVGVSRAAWLLARTARHSAAFARHVRARAIPAPPHVAAARQAGDRIVVLDDKAPFALTYGMFLPRVLVTTGLLGALSGTELAAVLAHEREHLRNHDPLKNVLARAMLARHFYLPALAGLRDRFTSGRELSADRAARAIQGAGPLAGALLKVTAGPAWAAASPSAAMSNDALLEARISQLETGAEPPPPRTGRRAVLYTLTSGVLLGFGIAWSAVIVAHYMPQCLPGLR